jgi:apolipoprotein N-acyltransferase
MRFRLPQRRLALLAAAVLFSLSFAPLPFWFLAYLFVPVFIAATQGLTFKEGFRSGYLFGMVISLLCLYWVVYVTITGVILLIFVHALYYAAIAGLLSASTRKYGASGLILFPFIWVAIEYIRSLSQLSFPWLNISYTQAANLPIVQLSALSGDATVSFFVIVVGIILYLGYHYARQTLRASLIFAVALVFYACAYLWGVSQIVPVAGNLRVAALQGNIPINQKWQPGGLDRSFRNYDSLSQAAVADSARLLILPESAVPAYLYYEDRYIAWLESITKRYNVDLMTGALHLVRTDDAKKHFYNSAFMFTPQGMNKVPYNKHLLVPFGEHMPYAEKIGVLSKFRDFVKNKLNLDISDFEPGDSLSTFASNGKRFGVLICFETVYPEFVRDLVNSGADFLTSITNDDWFGPTSGPYQHAVIPIFRAVENRIWIVRAANTGISEIINPYGQIIAKTKLGETTFLSGVIGDRLPSTPFRVYGAVVSKICLAVAALAALFLLFSKGHHD